jgi:hypothetical protein
MSIYTVSLYGDFDMPNVAWIGDDLVKAHKYIDEITRNRANLDGDSIFILSEWKNNSNKSNRLKYTPKSERVPYQG